MLSCLTLDLSDCRAIAAAAHAEADASRAAVSVAIVDAGGHPLLLERRDGASPASAAAALAKARMAALNGKPTASMEAAINGERPALLQLAAALGQPAVAMAGGLPLLVAGQCLGGLGISGMTPDLDGRIAEAAQAAFAGLPAATSSHSVRS
ncbi:MAG: heme-binding protein [Synechococcaceae cyanobacterium]|nr:heme-binding protein [Synechococcaceae cyanobacterium]